MEPELGGCKGKWDVKGEEAARVEPVVENLPVVHKVLESIPSTNKQK